MAKYLRKIKRKNIDETLEVMYNINSGVTFTNFKYKTSIIGISDVSNKEQFFNTLVHELKHVQSHICEYYNIDESSEEAAYLIGYLMLKFIKHFK